MARAAKSDPKKTRKPRAKKGDKATEAKLATSSEGSDGTSIKFKRPAKEQVVRLVKSLELMHSEAKQITSSMGEKIAKATENQHFDKVALGIARKLWKRFNNNAMQGAITLIHVLAYIDDLELSN